MKKSFIEVIYEMDRAYKSGYARGSKSPMEREPMSRDEFVTAGFYSPAYESFQDGFEAGKTNWACHH